MLPFGHEKPFYSDDPKKAAKALLIWDIYCKADGALNTVPSAI